MARVSSGDSSLSIQQRVEDAGFTNIVVTPMGSDKVFLHCLDGEDIWKVVNEAIDFFSIMFGHLHKWSDVDEKYERGAWIRVYGILAHAWNELFFKLCVSSCGRYIRSDECTLDKARLDFARVLISTSFLEVVNTTAEVIIDGCKHSIKLVEEWGCYLGEDAFLSEDGTETRTEALSHRDDVPVMDDIQADMDELVQDLSKEWIQPEIHLEGKNNDVHVAAPLVQNFRDDERASDSGMGDKKKQTQCWCMYNRVLRQQQQVTTVRLLLSYYYNSIQTRIQAACY